MLDNRDIAFRHGACTQPSSFDKITSAGCTLTSRPNLIGEIIGGWKDSIREMVARAELMTLFETRHDLRTYTFFFFSIIYDFFAIAERDPWRLAFISMSSKRRYVESIKFMSRWMRHGASANRRRSTFTFAYVTLATPFGIPRKGLRAFRNKLSFRKEFRIVGRLTLIPSDDASSISPR